MPDDEKLIRMLMKEVEVLGDTNRMLNKHIQELQKIIYECDDTCRGRSIDD